MRRLVVAVTGTTGVIYGIRLLEVLRGIADVETHLIVSRTARRVIVEETDVAPEAVEALAARSYDNGDVGAAPAGSAFQTAGMMIVPCAGRTVGALAAGNPASLITRAADVTLKEGRPLVLVPPDTPWHLGDLRRLRALAEMGAVILPPMPAFYPRPRTVEELVDHTVGRILDRFGIAHTLVEEWTGHARPPARRGRPSA
jgi:4-hydroxy-3-polyprenylbenzoate decarboxylase